MIHPLSLNSTDRSRQHGRLDADGLPATESACPSSSLANRQPSREVSRGHLEQAPAHRMHGAHLKTSKIVAGRYVESIQPSSRARSMPKIHSGAGRHAKIRAGSLPHYWRNHFQRVRLEVLPSLAFAILHLLRSRQKPHLPTFAPVKQPGLGGTLRFLHALDAESNPLHV